MFWYFYRLIVCKLAQEKRRWGVPSVCHVGFSLVLRCCCWQMTWSTCGLWSRTNTRSLLRNMAWRATLCLQRLGTLWVLGLAHTQTHTRMLIRKHTHSCMCTHTHTHTHTHALFLHLFLIAVYFLLNVFKETKTNGKENWLQAFKKQEQTHAHTCTCMKERRGEKDQDLQRVQSKLNFAEQPQVHTPVSKVT